MLTCRYCQRPTVPGAHWGLVRCVNAECVAHNRNVAVKPLAVTTFVRRRGYLARRLASKAKPDA